MARMIDTPKAPPLRPALGLAEVWRQPKCDDKAGQRLLLLTRFGERGVRASVGQDQPGLSDEAIQAIKPVAHTSRFK